jgi:hypothetical protein
MTAGFAAIWVISQGTEPVLSCEGANVISTALIRSYSAGRMWISAPALLPQFWFGLGVGSVAWVPA